MDSQPSANTDVLLERHRAGDKAALQVLLQRYYPRIACMVRVRMGAALRQRETEDDVVQEAFVRIVESIDTYERRGDAEWIDWVARTVQNALINLARYHGAAKRKATREVSINASASASASRTGFDIAADGSSIAGKASQRELQAMLEMCIAELAEDHREVILLREYARHDWQTVADKMQRSTPEACQMLYRRARRQLEERLAGRM